MEARPQNVGGKQGWEENASTEISLLPVQQAKYCEKHFCSTAHRSAVQTTEHLCKHVPESQIDCVKMDHDNQNGNMKLLNLLGT